MSEKEAGWTDVSPNLEKKNPWIYRGIILLGILLILIDLYRAYRCMQDPCCDLHYLLINKDAVCPQMLPEGALKWPV